MGYYIYDSNGYVGDLASITGYHELCDYLIQQNPKFKTFVEQGYTPIIKESLAEIMNIKLPDDQMIAKTIENFQQLAKKCQDILIVTDGVF